MEVKKTNFGPLLANREAERDWHWTSISNRAEENNRKGLALDVNFRHLWLHF